MPMRHWVRVVGSVAVLALVLGSCGGDDDDSGSADGADEETTSTAGETTTTTLSPEDEVLAAYQAASDALLAAHDPPNPDHPDLLATHAGDALSRVQDSLRSYAAEGVSLVGTIEPDPTPTSILDTTAVIEDCVVNREQQVYTDTRESLTEIEETVVHIESHLERIDGTWKVVSEQELSEPCTPG